jgi:hypothetical protein
MLTVITISRTAAMSGETAFLLPKLNQIPLFIWSGLTIKGIIGVLIFKAIGF